MDNSTLKWRIRMILAFLFLDMRLPVWIIQGKTRGSGRPFCLAHAGRFSTTAHRWARHLLQEGYTIHSLHSMWVFTIRRNIHRAGYNCQMLLLENSLLTRSYAKAMNGFRVPLWLQMGIDLRPPMEEIRGKRKSGLGDIMRLIRKNNLTGEVKRNPGWFDEFYHNMHVPLVRKRHGPAAEVLSYMDTRRIFYRSDTVMVKHLGRPVAALLISYYRKKLPTLRFAGVLNGSEELIRMGAIGALYYFAIEHLKARGFAEINLGGIHPFINDGLTAYKARLPAKIARYTHLSSRCLQMILLGRSESMQEVLKDNPFMSYDNRGALCRTLFIDSDSIRGQNEWRQLLYRTRIQGIYKTQAYVFGNSAPPAYTECSDDASVQVKPADSVFAPPLKEKKRRR